MTLSDRNWERLFRTLADGAVAKAVKQARTPRILTGAVEDLNHELDVVAVRMDKEVMGNDPTRSMNQGFPGIVFATRLGSTFTGEQARVEFVGSAGASAMQTSVENRIVLPFGKTSGQRIELDGELGTIFVFDEDDEVVGYISPERWFAGKDGASHAQFDPFGGIRLYSGEGLLTIAMEPSGKIFVRDPADTGLNFIEISTEGVKILDPANGQDIIISTASAGSIPAARYAGTSVALPGTTSDTPAAVAGHANDLEIRHVATWVNLAVGAQTFTPPSVDYTERMDVVSSGNGATLAATIATRGAGTATPNAVRTFTSTFANWQFDTGHTVVVRGDDVNIPAFRSLSQAFEIFTTARPTYTISLGPPAGLAVGDKMVAFVSFGNTGGSVPSSWLTPDGWVFLGAKFSTAGNSTIATGVWEKTATAEDVAMVGVSEYLVDIVAPGGGTKKFHGCIVAVQTPGQIGGGADIKIGGTSLSRGLIRQQTPITTTGPLLTATATTDFVLTDVPLVAGRLYQARLHTPYRIAAIGNNGIWTLDVRVNGVVVGQIGRFRFVQGTSERVHDATCDFTVASTGFYDIDIRAVEDENGQDLTFLASATAPRYLAVFDAGST